MDNVDIKELYTMGIRLIESSKDSKKKGIFNSRQANVHISYSQWSDLLCIFYHDKIALEMEMGSVKKISNENIQEVKRLLTEDIRRRKITL